MIAYLLSPKVVCSAVLILLVCPLLISSYRIQTLRNSANFVPRYLLALETDNLKRNTFPPYTYHVDISSILYVVCNM